MAFLNRAYVPNGSFSSQNDNHLWLNLDIHDPRTYGGSQPETRESHEFMQQQIPTKPTINEGVSDSTIPSESDTFIIEEVQQPENPTQLRRDLKERQVNMFAFSLMIGCGLYLQSGQVINFAGPGVASLAYPVMVMVIWAIMGALGEMTALFPVPGALFELPARFLDESIGYAAGWMAWFSWVVIFASELVAVAMLFNFRFDEQYLKDKGYPTDSLQWPTYGDSSAIWVALFIPVSVLINLLPIKFYGEFEYCIGVVKMILCVVIIVFQLAINVEANLGARYYKDPVKHPGPETGALAQLKGVWTGFCIAIYSLIGFESISITAAESEEFDEHQRFASEEGVKISTKKVAIRILLIYTLSTFIVSFNVPADDVNLVNARFDMFGGGENSPFVIAAVLQHERIWPSLLAGFFVFTTVSASINSLYMSSRLLHALALSRPMWPDYDFAHKVRLWLARVTRNGVPRHAILTSSVFGLLGFLACGKNDSKAVLGHLARNSVISMLIQYTVICVTFVKFKDSLRKKVRGLSSTEVSYQPDDLKAFDRDARETYPYKSHWQPLRSILAGSVCVLVITFNGWDTFKPFNPSYFFASYISPVVFGIIWFAYRWRASGELGWKIWRLAPTGEMSRPTRMRRSSGDPGRTHLNLDVEKFWSQDNLAKLKSWLWVWLK